MTKTKEISPAPVRAVANVDYSHPTMRKADSWGHEPGQSTATMNTVLQLAGKLTYEDTNQGGKANEAL